MKRRGERIQREYDGLKALVFSLVGGRELYENWEREWREQFGGEEADINEEEDGDDDEGSDDEDEKPKKRARTSPSTAPPQKEVKVEVAPPPPAAIPGPGPGELKRKRGRPRKVQPTVAASETPPASGPQTPSYTFMPQQQTHSQAVGADRGKLFLGVFLLFSLFNPPSSNSLHSHTHSGTVLGSISQSFLPDSATQYVSSPGLQPLATSKLVNYAHSAVTLVLFISVMMSIFPSYTHRLASFWRRSPPKNLVQPSDLEGDKERLQAALGCRSVNFPMLISAVAVGTWYAFWAWLGHFAGIRPRPISVTLERRAWFRLAELELADGICNIVFQKKGLIN